MIRKMLVIVALTTTLFAAHVPTAKADTYAGACAVNMTIYFDQVVRLLTVQRGFTYDLNGNCPFILGGGQVAHDTFAYGGANAIMWNCEITAADGDWEQWWDPMPPDGIIGDFTMAGSFGGWDLAITAPGTIAHGHLVLAPDHVGAPLECEGDGLWELRLTGVIEFEMTV